MKKWPTSGWAQAGIALASAFVFSAMVLYLTYRYVLATNHRTTPQYGETGWNSLGASAGGLAAAFWTFPIAFILTFAVQRIFARERDIDFPTDEPPTEVQWNCCAPNLRRCRTESEIISPFRSSANPRPRSSEGIVCIEAMAVHPNAFANVN
jgi:hypothetical protein